MQVDAGDGGGVVATKAVNTPPENAAAPETEAGKSRSRTASAGADASALTEDLEPPPPLARDADTSTPSSSLEKLGFAPHHLAAPSLQNLDTTLGDSMDKFAPPSLHEFGTTASGSLTKFDPTATTGSPGTSVGSFAPSLPASPVFVTSPLALHSPASSAAPILHTPSRHGDPSSRHASYDSPASLHQYSPVSLRHASYDAAVRGKHTSVSASYDETHASTSRRHASYDTATSLRRVPHEPPWAAEQAAPLVEHPVSPWIPSDRSSGSIFYEDLP